MAKMKTATPLKIGKKKSAGWRPWEKRPLRPEPERKARRHAVRAAQAREECDELRLWFACRAPRCRRVRGCTKDPQACLEQRRAADAAKARATAGASPASAAAAPSPPTAPMLSAREGAAAIAASIAEAIARGEISDED
jgi:hypothetical protein